MIDQIARAVLYEGYLLYPYRRSSVKNRRRLAMGAIFPEGVAAPGEPTELVTECLVTGAPETATARVSLRFLHLAERFDGADTDAWHEADEREIGFAARRLAALGAGETDRFWFGARTQKGDGWRRVQAGVAGVVETSATGVAAGTSRLRVRVRNVSLADDDDGDAALLRCFASAHLVIRVEQGELVSLLEPPEALRAAAAGCTQVGVWPVLVGPPGSRDAMMASPVILYDHPRVAPESPGDLFDGTEIDEILTLRILTLTDAEKAEARATDPRARALLDRTENLPPEALARLHGAIRARRRWAVGDRVRLRPRRRADVMDLALAGRAATIESIEEDLEGRLHVAVTVDDDPGRDLGAYGHRFFFAEDELEALP